MVKRPGMRFCENVLCGPHHPVKPAPTECSLSQTRSQHTHKPRGQKTMPTGYLRVLIPHPRYSTS